MKRFTLFLFLSMTLSVAAFAHNKSYFGLRTSHTSKQKAKAWNLPVKNSLQITQVIPGTPAEKAGLQAFDFITAIKYGEAEASTNLHWFNLNVAPGEAVSFTYIRNGKQASTTVYPVAWQDRKQYKIDQCDRPFLGVGYEHGYRKSEEGVFLNKVYEGSTAKKEGIQKDDRLLEINGYPIIDWHDVTASVRMLKPGDQISVIYDREGTQKGINATIGSQCDEMDEAEEAEDEEIIVAPQAQGSQAASMDMDLEPISQQESADMEKKYGLDMPVDNSLKADLLEIFPNPNQGRFQLRFDINMAGSANLVIFDGNGKLVFSGEVNTTDGKYQMEIDLSRESRGVYYLQLASGDKKLSKRLVIR